MMPQTTGEDKNTPPPTSKPGEASEHPIAALATKRHGKQQQQQRDNNSSGSSSSKENSNDKADARQLLEKADELLKQVDEAFLSNNTVRQYPTFDREEIRYGQLLGVGGFGIVFEISDLALQRDRQPVGEDSKEESSSPADATATTVALMVNGGAMIRDDDGTAAHDEHHYHVDSARRLMKERVLHNNKDARYAIKRLHRDLTPTEQARGTIDLAIEAKFLSVLWHPNIIKMRAIASGSMMDPKFFIVLDRLYETLDKKIRLWETMSRQFRGGFLGFGKKKNKLELQQLLVERMIVGYDLAAALWYMHEKGLVYRDVKQENIGFDCRGDVKLFDFGLSKALSDDLKDKKNHGYMLTPRTGSIPYMAPEVAECKSYDEKCDVFSFAVLLWEILSMAKAFKLYTRREYLERVVRKGERLRLGRSWSPLTRLVLGEAWDADPKKRPDMKRVAVMIRGDLNELTSDPTVRERTTHMRERSRHSFRLDNTKSYNGNGGGAAPPPPRKSGHRQVNGNSKSAHSLVSSDDEAVAA